MANASEIWCLLTSHGKLERDRGVEILKEICNSYNAKPDSTIKSCILTSNPPFDELLRTTFEKLVQYPICLNETPWETKIGILTGCQVLVEGVVFNPALPGVFISTEIETRLIQSSMLLLSDEEVRVRIAAGDLLGALGRKLGISVYEDSKEMILSLIKTNLEREESSLQSEKLPFDSPSNMASSSVTSKQIFHETAGWRHLETSMKCLQSVVNGCGPSFMENVDSDLLDLINLTTEHPNRFVRETGYQTLASIIDAAATHKCYPTSIAPDQIDAMETEPVFETELEISGQLVRTIHNISLAKVLANGLSDNWSQVRLSASVASRSFLTSMPPNIPGKHTIYSLMVPRICLNRYYLAEGVRIYSQETWKLVTNPEVGGGKKVVETYLNDVVTYYTSCTKADNHAVREAACQCIAEIAAKLDKKTVETYVDILLDTLLECFNDDSWPVRDMACVAAGKFVLNFPAPSKRCVDKLKELFLINLQDAISSVRQGAALALANLTRAYEENETGLITLDLLLKIEKSLENISTQPTESKKFNGLETSSIQSNFGVAKRIRDNDPDLHTNQTMYSCGSLAPKMKGTGSSGGCSDCKFQKETEPWEVADGAVLLLCELTNIQSCREKIIKSNLVQKIADACRHRHYVAHYFFLETVLKTLPLIGQNLGKRSFKLYLEDFMDHIFYAAKCENALASAAAFNCLKKLSDLLGPNIMRGRVEQFHSRYLDILDDALNSTQGPNMAGMFSPPVMNNSIISNVSSPIAISSDKQPSLGGTPTGSPIN